VVTRGLDFDCGHQFVRPDRQANRLSGLGRLPAGRALGALPPEAPGRSLWPITSNTRLLPFGLRSPTRGEAAAAESSGRAHSVPRPACGGAMLTLLQERRFARLRRRPELAGASRPLRRAGS
jgi:hypothetical protein